MIHHHTQRKEQQQRDDLTGEHAVGDAGQAVLACLFAATWITDTFFFQYSTFLNQHVPLGVRIPFGVVLLVLSGYLARTGMSIVFGEKRKKPGVIRESVFSVVRHPVYLSEILLYLGLLMLSVSLAAAMVWIVAIGFLHYISRYEERLLLTRFGEEHVHARSPNVDSTASEEVNGATEIGYSKPCGASNCMPISCPALRSGA